MHAISITVDRPSPRRFPPDEFYEFLVGTCRKEVLLVFWHHLYVTCLRLYISLSITLRVLSSSCPQDRKKKNLCEILRDYRRSLCRRRMRERMGEMGVDHPVPPLSAPFFAFLASPVPLLCKLRTKRKSHYKYEREKIILSTASLCYEQAAP